MRFSSKPIAEHPETPLADDGRWERLINHWQRRDAAAKTRETTGNACYVVSVRLGNEEADPARKLAEIVDLVRAQGDRVVGQEVHRLGRPDPRTYLGRGTAAEIAERAFDSGADMLVLDAELSPSQMRNLEDAAGLPICDREAVILNVFLRHAKTRSARIQVEVAQLEYLRPRIRGLGLEMDQQAGGMMRARGPGETASELLARRLDGRLADLRRALNTLRVAGDTQRRRRERCHRIALVGYTNAGKTSLMNALTSSALSARSMPFETLDITSRCLTRHGGDVVLSDTVGFIRRLPERLFASFESTLAEITEASLLVLVVDTSDSEWRMHLQTTERVLAKLHADHLDRFYVFNKIDLLDAPMGDAFAAHAEQHQHLALSSHDPAAVAMLRAALLRRVRRTQTIARVFVAYDAPELMSAVYAQCRVLAADPREKGIRFTLEGSERAVSAIRNAGMRLTR